jgi:hypothetical protein
MFQCFLRDWAASSLENQLTVLGFQTLYGQTTTLLTGDLEHSASPSSRHTSAVLTSTVNPVISSPNVAKCNGQNVVPTCCCKIRARALDRELRPLFARWYSGLPNDKATGDAQPAAARIPHKGHALWLIYLSESF